MTISKRTTCITAAITLLSAFSTVQASNVNGAGASFIYPLMSKWSVDYRAATGNKINYQSIGSGGGIAQIKAGTVDFGSSDAPLKPEDLAKSGLMQFPSAIGGVVPVVNLAGIKPDEFRLSGEVLANIYLGKIKNWNDPALIALNPTLKLGNAKITVVNRSDGSGTTFNFVNYLGKVSAEWKNKVGEGTTVKWPVGIGGKGNEGVAAYVKQIKYSIGYIELSSAIENRMSYVSMQNAAGNWVLPNDDTFQAAAAGADWKNAKDFYLVMTNSPADQAWPIAACNFILMYKKPKNINQNKAALDFFRWTQVNGKKQAQALQYVPLPDSLVTQIHAYWKASGN